LTIDSFATLTQNLRVVEKEELPFAGYSVVPRRSATRQRLCDAARFGARHAQGAGGRMFRRHILFFDKHC
jgi:hypothetical protein